MFKEMGEQIAKVNEQNGWEKIVPEDWDSRDKIPALLALVHSEVSEATEGFRHNDRANFAEELADTIIRIVSIAHGLGMDLQSAITAKIEANKLRGHHHGGKKL